MEEKIEITKEDLEIIQYWFENADEFYGEHGYELEEGSYELAEKLGFFKKYEVNENE